MQLAASGDEERIGVAGLVDAQRDVGQHLLGQSVAQIARRHVLAFAPRERRRVDLEVHRQRRLVDHDRRQRLGRLDRSERRADRELVDAGDEHDVAGLRRFDGHALHAREGEDLRHPRFRRELALGERSVQHGDLLPRCEATAADPADAEPPDVARIVERGDLELQRRVGIASRRRHVREDRFEQRPHVGTLGRRVRLRDVDVERRPAVQRRRVDDRKIELLLGRADPVEELERLVDDPLRPRAGTIDLVDDDDRRQAELQRLQRHESRLRHRPLDRVDEQQHAVDHPQHALDLAAEIGVARRVDDVDVRVAVADRAVLGEDRDPALALEVVGVHHAFGDVLVLRERAGLDQQLVDERRLAVVDVGDDRDVAQHPGWLGHGRTSRRVAPADKAETVPVSRPGLAATDRRPQNRTL